MLVYFVSQKITAPPFDAPLCWRPGAMPLTHCYWFLARLLSTLFWCFQVEIQLQVTVTDDSVALYWCAKYVYRDAKETHSSKIRENKGGFSTIIMEGKMQANL